MASKGVVSAATGLGAGLLLTAAYVGAPYAGVHLTQTAITLAAAVAAFGASVALLTLTAISTPDAKRPKPWTRISDLASGQYLAFPRSGPRIVVKPDTFLKDLDLRHDPSAYQTKDVMIIVKKTSAKTPFNPLVIGEILAKVAPFGGFQHLLLLNEHDEFVGYLPSWTVRTKILGTTAVAQITKYIINVLDDPAAKSSDLREIGGLGIAECVSDTLLVTQALKILSEGLFRGLVICRGKRNRKPYGVIFEEQLVKAAIASLE